MARHAAGFSLLELLIVLALIALVSAVGLSFGGGAFDRNNAEVTAQEVAQALRRARARAIAGNVDHALALDVEARQMRVDGEAVRPLPDRIELSLLTAASERSAANIGAIRFFPDGSSTGGEVGIADARQGFTVRVEWLTGSIEVVRAPAAERPRR